jgi:hypothetical protein
MTTRGKGSGKKEDCGEADQAAAAAAAAEMVLLLVESLPTSVSNVAVGINFSTHTRPACSVCVAALLMGCHATSTTGVNMPSMGSIFQYSCSLQFALLPLPLLLLLLLTSCPKGSLHIQRHGQKVPEGAPCGMTLYCFQHLHCKQRTSQPVPPSMHEHVLPMRCISFLMVLSVDSMTMQQCPGWLTPFQTLVLQGTFASDFNDQPFCSKCPQGLTTKDEGSADAGACSYAQRGMYVSSTGEAVACPLDTYSDTERNDTACIPCPFGLKTESTGSEGVAMCLAPPGWELR